MRFGQGYRLNLLDLGAMGDAARRLRGAKGQQLRELALNRAVESVVVQIQIVRREQIADWEHSLLSNAVRALHNRPRLRRSPTLTELAQVLQNPTAEMMRSILVDTLDDYAQLTKKLNRSLHAVLEGPLGRMYDGQSTDRLRTDVPAVSIDISAVSRQSESVLASAMLASWSETFGAIEAANALADAGLAPQRHYLTVLDEMWRAMRLEGAGLVDKADSITRLNRNDGVGNMFITHSLRDMESMTSQADNMKARGSLNGPGSSSPPAWPRRTCGPCQKSNE